MITVKELSERLKVAEMTIYRWVKAGKIPYYMADKVLRFDYEEVKQALKK